MTANTHSPAMQEAGAHDLRTGEGGRAFVAEYFATQIGRHDFTRYITNTLAADFACALAQHLSKLRAPVADTAAIIRDVCELDPADEGPDTVRITVADLKLILERHSAPVAGEALPVCWIEKDALEGVRDEGNDAWVYWRPADHVAESDEVPLYAASKVSEAVRHANRQQASAPLLKAARRAILALAAAAERDPAFQGDYDALSAALSAQPGAQKESRDA